MASPEIYAMSIVGSVRCVEGTGAARYEPGGVAVALDLQQHMLLVLRTGRGLPLWLTVEQVTLPARWQDLRRAVYSRASTAAPMATPPGPEPAPSHSLHDRHP